MGYIATTTTRKLLGMRKRTRVVQGGTSAGKTISILQILIDDAQTDTSPTLTSVVSESFPHLRRGAMRDFLNIMQEHGYFKDDRWSKTDYTYTFESGSRLEFFSADQPSKVRGPRRDRLFLNECNNINFEAYTQLAIRTKDYVWLDFNPVAEFWVQDEVIQHEEHDFQIVTYLDNEGLSENIVQAIEARKANKNFWRVYGQGLLGEAEGRIYSGWKIIDEVPHEARLERRGLDFGYSNDPTAIVDVYYYNGGYIIDEQLYRKGMSNKDLADYVKNLEKSQTMIVADSAEPKSIDELKAYGLIMLPAEKGPGSINQGIQYVQDQKISLTKRSINLIKEYRNYLWMTDKDGKIINQAEGGNDHALDALRYALQTYKPTQQVHAYKPEDMMRLKYGQR